MSKQQNLLLSAIVFVIELNICLAVYTHLLTELGSYMDNSCMAEKCDRNVNEQLIQTMESYMNKNADPCEDFFDYACGNWKNISKLYSTFDQQEENFNILLVEIMQKLQLQLNENNHDPKINSAYKKALHYYNSCVEVETFDLCKFLAFIEPAASQKWPIYENRTSLPWNFEHFVWWKALAKLQSFSFRGALIEVNIDAQSLDGKLYTIDIAGYDTNKKMYLSKQVLKSMGNYTIIQERLLQWKLRLFEKKMHKLYKQISEEKVTLPTVNNITKEELLKNKRSELTELVKSVFDKDMPVEKGIEIVTNLLVTINNKAHNNSLSESDEVLLEKIRAFKPKASEEKYLSLNDLQSKLPDINWQQYFDILLHGASISPNAKIFTITNVKVLKQLISFYNEYSKETLALYMLVRFLGFLSSDIPIDSKNITCAKAIGIHMPLIVAYLYEHYHYGAIRNDSDLVINNIFLRLKTKLNDLFEDSEIDLDPTEIEFLQRKVKKLTLNIGNLPVNKSVEFLVEQYATVHITNATNFYSNHLELLRNRRLLLYRLMNASQSNSTNIFETFYALDFTASASPYYLPWFNSIMLPFAYLRMPLYHHKLHDVFLFGELAWALGHEIMHGFDLSGLSYDADGNQYNIGQNIRQKKSFTKKIECLAEQATASLDERIADISGLHLVVKTFLNDRTSKTSKFHTHSTTLSNRQLFFVKLSHYFCVQFAQNRTDLSALDHDFSEVRIVYSMANTKEFAHEFKCQEESAMKAKHICSLW